MPSMSLARGNSMKLSNNALIIQKQKEQKQKEKENIITEKRKNKIIKKK